MSQTMNVTMPDGTVITDVPVGTTKEQLLAKLEGRGAVGNVPDVEQTETETSTLDGSRGLAQTLGKGLLFGGADEFEGALAATFDKFLGNDAEELLQSHEDIQSRDRSWSDDFEMFTQDARDSQQAWADANPGAAMAAEIGGAMLTGGAGIAKAGSAVAKRAAASRAAGAAGQSAVRMGAAAGAGAAAAEAGLYGFLDADASLEERLEAAGKYAVGGAAFGGAVGAGLAKGGQALVNRAQRRAVEEAHAKLNNLDDSLVLASASPEIPMQDKFTMALRESQMGVDEYKAALELTGRPKLRIRAMSADLAQDANNIKATRQHAAESVKGFWQWAGKKKEQILNNPTRTVLGVASTTLRDKAPRMFNRARKFELDVKSKQQKIAAKLTKLDDMKKEMGRDSYKAFTKAVLSGDFNVARAVVPPQYRAVVETAFKEITKLEGEARSVGYLFDSILNYWPRKVKDVAGYRAALGRRIQDEADQHVAKAQAKAKKPLTPDQIERLRTEYMTNANARHAGEGKPGFARDRTIGTISDEMVEFYEDPITALNNYIHRLTEDVEMKKFFNQSGAGGSLRGLLQRRMQPGDEDTLLELNESIGALVEREVRDPEAREAVRQVLSARFGGGRQSMSRGLQNVKDVSTVTALGQISSTITQIGDLANAVYLNGVRPTMKAILRQARRKGVWSLDEIGMDNVIAQDIRLSGENGIDKFVDTVLDKTGFKFMDRLGKRTIVDGAFFKANRDLNRHGKAGVVAAEKFVKKWGDIYGPDTANVMASLKAGVKDEWTQLHVFHALSDVQPITALEMPVAYLNNPNARLMYTLKSYALKQADILRRDVFNENLAQGTRLERAATLGKFLTLTGMFNGGASAIKDVLSGGELPSDPEEFLTDKGVESLANMVFLGKYNRDQLWSTGGGVDWMASILMPAAPDVTGALSGNPEQLARSVPIVGKPLYDWFLGGKEKAAERKRQDRIRELTE